MTSMFSVGILSNMHSMIAPYLTQFLRKKDVTTRFARKMNTMLFKFKYAIQFLLL